MVQQNGMKKASDAAMLCTVTVYAIIFEKIAKLDLRALSKLNGGELSNHITNDLMRVVISIYCGHQIILSPTLLMMYIIILLIRIGVVALAGLGVVLLIMILAILISLIIAKQTGKKLKLTGSRNKEINFSISGIKTVKFNAWENITKEILNKIRLKEKSILRTILFLQNLSDVLTYVLPSLAGFICIVIYNNYNEALSLGDIFFIITIFNLLVTPLKVFFFGFMSVTQAVVALKRINKMLILPEEPNKKILLNQVSEGTIKFEDASHHTATVLY